jgi:hypothetical protein
VLVLPQISSQQSVLLETSVDNKLTDGVRIWSKNLVYLSNARFESFLLLAILLDHVNARLHFVIMLLVFTHTHLVTHSGPKSFLEVRERNITFLLWVENCVH